MVGGWRRSGIGLAWVWRRFQQHAIDATIASQGPGRASADRETPSNRFRRGDAWRRTRARTGAFLAAFFFGAAFFAFFGAACALGTSGGANRSSSADEGVSR